MPRHVRHLAHDALPRILLVLPIASRLKHRPRPSPHRPRPPSRRPYTHNLTIHARYNIFCVPFAMVLRTTLIEIVLFLDKCSTTFDHK